MSCGSDFKVKDRRKKLWNLPPLLRNASEAKQVLWMSLSRDPEKSLCEAVKAKCMLPWRPQDDRNARVMWDLPRLAVKRECYQFKRKKCVTVNKVERNWGSQEYIDINHGDAKFWVCPAGFGLSLVQCFLNVINFLHYGTMIYNLCHYKLHCVICIFTLILYKITVKRISWL